MDSPVGELTLIGSAKGLAAVPWENDDLNKRDGRLRKINADG